MLMKDEEAWATARVEELAASGEDEAANVGFVKTAVGFHSLGPFSSTGGGSQAVVVRSTGRIERREHVALELLRRAVLDGETGAAWWRDAEALLRFEGGKSRS